MRLLPRGRERSGALSHATREMPAAGGQSWHAAPRSRTEGERPLVDAVALYRVKADYIQRGAAHARGKHACCASSPETASVVVHSCACHAKCSAGGRSRHIAPRSRTGGERPLPGAVPFCVVWGDQYPRGMARARGKRVCCASSRERASAVARPRPRARRESRLRKEEAAAGTSHHGLAP